MTSRCLSCFIHTSDGNQFLSTCGKLEEVINFTATEQQQQNKAEFQSFFRQQKESSSWPLWAYSFPKTKEGMELQNFFLSFSFSLPPPHPLPPPALFGMSPSGVCLPPYLEIKNNSCSPIILSYIPWKCPVQHKHSF